MKWGGLDFDHWVHYFEQIGEVGAQLKKFAAEILIYCQICNIRCTLVGNKIVDHSDVVGASPVGATPTTSSF